MLEGDGHMGWFSKFVAPREVDKRSMQAVFDGAMAEHINTYAAKGVTDAAAPRDLAEASASLLGIVEEAQKSERPIDVLRLAIMDAVDGWCLNESILDSPVEVLRKARVKQDLSVISRLAHFHGFHILCLRKYAALHYNDAIEHDWLDPYIKMSRLHAKLKSEIVLLEEGAGPDQVKAGIYEMSESALRGVRQELLGVPIGTRFETSGSGKR